MRLKDLHEDIYQDSKTAEHIVEFDPKTVTKHEFRNMINQLKAIHSNDPIIVNGESFTTVEDAAKKMLDLVQDRIEAHKAKYSPYQWQHGPYKNSELVPIWWLEKIKGNDLRTQSTQSLGYNPDIDDYDRGTFDDLMRSMDERGLQEPVTIIVGMRDGHAYIGEGNHRIEAGKRLGWRELPARVIVYDVARGLRGSGTYSHNVRNDLKWNPDTLGSFPDQKYYTKPSQVFKSLSR